MADVHCLACNRFIGSGSGSAELRLQALSHVFPCFSADNVNDGPRTYSVLNAESRIRNATGTGPDCANGIFCELCPAVAFATRNRFRMGGRPAPVTAGRTPLVHCISHVRQSRSGEEMAEPDVADAIDFVGVFRAIVPKAGAHVTGMTDLPPFGITPPASPYAST